MGANKTPIDKGMTREKAISQGGYYNTDGDWNCIITDDGYPGKILRGRVEVLVLKDGKLFMCLRENGRYRIPGGGFDRGVLNIDQAFIETKEEAKLIIGNIRYTGVTYIRLFEEAWGDPQKEIIYDGTYNEVYIADYKGEYEGYIRKGLSDSELTNKGKFYDLSEVENILLDPHKQALMNMLTTRICESATNSDLGNTIIIIQNTLRNLHDRLHQYMCIQNRDVESDNGGYIFAQYNTTNQSEADEVKRFINYCNYFIKQTLYTAYIEEPITYNGNGLIIIKNKEIDTVQNEIE